MYPLRPSATSTALCHLYGPLPPLQPSVLSTALCLLYSSFPLYDPLSPLRPSVLFMALSEKSETTCLVSRNVLPNAFCKTPRVVAFYFVLAMIAIIMIITIITQAKYSAIIVK
jgi:hypothetical protein